MKFSLHGKIMKSFVASAALIMAAVVPCNSKGADAGHKNQDRIYWTNGRALIQHYQSLQSVPTEWKAELQQKLHLAAPESIEDCVATQNYTGEVFDECTKIGLNEIRNQILSRRSINSPLFEKLKIFSSIWERFSRISNWESWVRLAAAGTLSGDYEYASRMIRVARDVLPAEDSDANWKRERIDIFEAALGSLIESPDAKTTSLARTGKPLSNDPASRALTAEVHRLTVGSKDITNVAGGKGTNEQNLSNLVRKKWILAQDREEINTLKSMILNNEFSLEAIRRIDSLVRQNHFYNREWQAILKIISAVSAKVELFERNRGLMLPLEWWMSRKEKNSALLSFDDDRMLVRQIHLQDEFAKSIANIADKFAQGLEDPQDRQQVLLLRDRMTNIVSSVSRALNGLPTSEITQYAEVIRRRSTDQETAIRKVQAKIASLEMTGTPDADLMSLLTGFRSELQSLRVERSDILAEYASTSVNLMPSTLARHAVLNSRNDQIRRTLIDLKKIVSGVGGVVLDGTQAGYFFAEADQLLKRISSESSNHLEQKKKEAREIASSFKYLARGVSDLRDDFARVMAQTGPQIRVPVTKVLMAMEADIFRQERAIELQEQLLQTDNKDILEKQQRALEWQRERIEDLRRIKSENLEWRLGR